VEAIVESLQGALQQQEDHASSSGRKEMSSVVAQYADAAGEVLQALLRCVCVR
jgi:hypothetical protein